MLAPLLNRSAELGRLRQHWAACEQGASRLVLVYGRQQVGKTFLLRHLYAGLPREANRLYVTALPNLTVTQQLTAFRQSVATQLGDRSWVPDSFASWRPALDFTLDLARRTPTLLVLDELPFLLDVDRSLGGCSSSSGTTSEPRRHGLVCCSC